MGCWPDQCSKLELKMKNYKLLVSIENPVNKIENRELINANGEAAMGYGEI